MYFLSSEVFDFNAHITRVEAVCFNTANYTFLNAPDTMSGLVQFSVTSAYEDSKVQQTVIMTSSTIIYTRTYDATTAVFTSWVTVSGGGAGAVSSVNGKTGAVVLVASDVGAYTIAQVDTDLALKANITALPTYATNPISSLIAGTNVTFNADSSNNVTINSTTSSLPTLSPIFIAGGSLRSSTCLPTAQTCNSTSIGGISIENSGDLTIPLLSIAGMTSSNKLTLDTNIELWATDALSTSTTTTFSYAVQMQDNSGVYQIIKVASGASFTLTSAGKVTTCNFNTGEMAITNNVTGNIMLYLDVIVKVGDTTTNHIIASAISVTPSLS